VAFEADSFLRDIGPVSFHDCDLLRSIAIPPFVGLLPREFVGYCRSLGSVIFERPFRPATIATFAFSGCQSLTWLFIPASVTTIEHAAFQDSGIVSIEVSTESVSFRVQDEFLIDFEIRSLVWVIGSPEKILIPASIEELGPSCCAWKERLRSVEFESDSTLRSIGRFAFGFCDSLESICIPSSVEVLCERCFYLCSHLRTVTFCADSKLRLIEEGVFVDCRSLESVSVPASAEVRG
jgi:hypothetical protein